MDRLIEIIQDHIPSDAFSDMELTTLLKGTAQRRYALVKRALAQQQLIRLRRGFYCLAEKYRRAPLNLFVLAQKIYGPSYISLESALSHHGWIPETVYTITSVTSKRSKEFENTLGQFIYRRISSDHLLTGVERVGVESGSFLIARPWKAVADYIYTYKKDWKGRKPLMESLRIEKEDLAVADPAELEEIESSYKSVRVMNFLRSIRKETP